MSTKIYSGYRLRLNGTPLPLFANEVRTVMVPLLRTVWHSTLVKAAINTFHRRQLGQAGMLPEQSDLKYSPWSFVTRDLKDDFKDSTYFSLVLFADPHDLSGEWTYLTVYAPSQWEQIFSGLFAESHGLEPFGYWNNSDQPDDVTDEEWENRYKTWERIGILDKPPVECGVSVEMFADSWWELEAMAPSWGDSTAIEKVMTNIVQQDDFLDKYSKRLAPDVDGFQTYASSESKPDASQVISFLLDRTRAEIRNEIADRVKEVITVPSWTDLRTPTASS